MGERRGINGMTNIQIVGRLEVLIVVDNVTDSLSSNPNKCKRSWWGLHSGQIGSLKTSSQSDAEIRGVTQRVRGRLELVSTDSR